MVLAAVSNSINQLNVAEPFRLQPAFDGVTAPLTMPATMPVVRAPGAVTWSSDMRRPNLVWLALSTRPRQDLSAALHEEPGQQAAVQAPERERGLTVGGPAPS